MKMSEKVNYNPENPSKCVPTSCMVCEYCNPKISRECSNKLKHDKEELFRKKWN